VCTLGAQTACAATPSCTAYMNCMNSCT
jgi:hypothetical protein